MLNERQVQFKKFVTMAEIYEQAFKLAVSLPVGSRLYGIPRGGVSAAMAVVPKGAFHLVDRPEEATVFIDDIYDSGTTAERYEGAYGTPVKVLFDKRLPQWAGQWLVMPWEGDADNDHSADDIIVRLLQRIGEDPMREGLRETPARVIKAWDEWATGYGQDPASILKCFEDGSEKYDEFVFQGSIPFFSTCEHHMAPFFGVAHVGYIPNGKVVGLSKLSRLVDIYSRRLQIQERIAVQVADALMENLTPLGVGVVLQARHLCMESRGISKIGTVTTTSALRGVVKERAEVRAEFMTFVSNASRAVRGV